MEAAAWLFAGGPSPTNFISFEKALPLLPFVTNATLTLGWRSEDRIFFFLSVGCDQTVLVIAVYFIAHAQYSFGSELGGILLVRFSDSVTVGDY